jgi:hypothetical protein
VRVRAAIAFVVGALAAFLPGLSGAKGGADVIAKNLGWVTLGGTGYWVIAWIGTGFAMLIAASGAAGIVGWFDRER